MKIKYQNCEIKYSREDDILVIDNIQVPQDKRNKGYAKRAMKKFINRYKNENIELHAYAQDEQTNTKKLVNFYESFGFDVVCGDDSNGYEMKN